MSDKKMCPRCGELLPASAFGLNRARPDKLSAYCLPCYRAVAQAWRDAHPEAEQRRRANNNLRLKRQRLARGLKGASND